MAVVAKEYGYFFNSSSGDRTYNADSFGDWMKPFFLPGVFNGDLFVQAQSTPDMSVKVGMGYANLDGKPAVWDAVNTLSIDIASGVYDRIDIVVARRDDANRQIVLDVVKGTASANPVAPSPTRDESVYELVLAEILVRTGTTEIEQMDITDKRMDPSVCGWVAATVDQIAFDQVKEQFDDWFDHVKGQLDHDVAGHLQNEIDALDNEIDALDASKLTGTQTTLSGSGLTNASEPQDLTEGVHFYTFTADDAAGFPITDGTLVTVLNGTNYAEAYELLLKDGSVNVRHGTAADTWGAWSYQSGTMNPAANVTSTVSVVRRDGNTVTCVGVCTWNSTTQTSGSYTIYSVPVWAKPTEQFYFVTNDGNGNVSSARISTNREIQVVRPVNNASYRFCITYVV